ncbi:MAG: hypothetical protein EXX96DRAFT_577139 [Benjaminiella poitrasii]|nr:MAG: hypothetical protein EXX96DRAFT_577139 [Benjaminiella poitrasii]
MMETYPYPYAYSSRFTGRINSNNNKPPMIPSKRAAQNRAAQRAFRQRKERHLKDLEEKVKLMDEWKVEIEQLRQENKELKENMMILERKMQQQHQQIFQQQQQTLELSQQYNYQQTRQRHPKHNYPSQDHQRKSSMPIIDNDSYKASTLTVAIQSQPRKSITRKPKLKQRIAKEKEFVHFYHAHDNLSFAPVNLVSPTVHQETVSIKSSSSSCVPEVPPLLSSPLAPSPVVFDNAQCQNQLWSSSSSTSSSSLSPPELSLDVFDIPLNTNIQWTDTNTLII